MKDTLVFIDAGFLSKLSKHFGDGKYLKYDIIKFAKNLAKNKTLNCKHIFYYTAPPFQSGRPTLGEKRRKENYDRFIQKLSSYILITVREGRCQRLRIANGAYEYKQKGVDSLIVMDLMTVPIKYKDTKKIILIACDSDFVPIITRLEELGIKVILYTYYDRVRNSKFSTSNELIETASRCELLQKKDFET